MTCRRCGHPEEHHNALAGCLGGEDSLCHCPSFEPAAEGSEDTRGRRSQADRLVEIGLGVEALFLDQRDVAFAVVRAGEHRECWPIRSKGFRDWLANRFYGETGGKAPNAEAMRSAILVLEARARYGGEPRRPVYLRVAPDGAGGVYIDLGEPGWSAVHVTAAGWQLEAEPPVMFRRPPGLGALPRPETGGDLEELRELLNLASEGDWALLRSWLVQALYPRGPYPVLALGGEQGSAKSTTARMLRGIVDPATPQLRSDPRDVRDLMVASSNAWLLAFDNVSRVQPWLSDALCRLSTGGGWATRELYTDSEEVLFEATRPVILNGIAEFITRGDLLDRAIQIRLPPIPEHARRPEDEVWSRFERARPRLLGALLERLSGALRERGRVCLDRLPRMADFARLAVAAERGSGEEPRFLAAYAGARAEADQAAVDGSPVGAALLAWIGGEELPWEGTAAEFLAALERQAGGDRPQGWPRTPRGLRAELDRLAPSLRRLGFAISSERRGHGRARLLRVEPEDGAARPSAPSASPADGPLAAASPRTVAPSATVRNRPQPSAVETASELRKRSMGDGADDADGSAAPLSEDDPDALRVLGVLERAEHPLAVPEIAQRADVSWVRVRSALEGPLVGRVRAAWDGGVQRFELVPEGVER